MRILITGYTGLVGRNVCEHLYAYHDLLIPTRSELDLLDRKKVENYFQNTKPDFLVHCAGVVGGIQANIKEPVKFFIENIEIGINVLMSAASARVKNVINLGSSCMYPRFASNPLKEEYILQGELEPTNEGYAIAKIATQRLCSYLCQENPSLNYKTIISCNLYGKWDKFNPANSHMIPAIIKKIYEAKRDGLAEVEIWGSGKARREFMYAGDLADFITYALNNFQEMPDIINVGIGRDYSIDEYYEIAARIIGYNGTFEHNFTKPEGMLQKVVDISKLESFGWKARTSIEEGISKTYEFFLNMESDTNRV